MKVLLTRSLPIGITIKNVGKRLRSKRVSSERVTVLLKITRTHRIESIFYLILQEYTNI